MISSAMPFNDNSNDEVLSPYYFPRTGKRGVPQQFPRRLYEMLTAESKQQDSNFETNNVIAWSESGLSFCIFNVAEFSGSILPKYFRTRKFSSFQRNLNLYGFNKLRRGSDIDMYAHPSFVRDHPESLVNLRKSTPSQRHCSMLKDASQRHNVMSNTSSESDPCLVPVSAHRNNVKNTSRALLQQHQQQKCSVQAIDPPFPQKAYHTFQYPGISLHTSERVISNQKNDRGKLDLLALAMEHELASRRGCV